MSPNSAADPSGREPLNESAEHEQGWSKCTDLAVGRKLPDCGGSHSDADESDRKHATASDAVAKRPEKQSPRAAAQRMPPRRLRTSRAVRCPGFRLEKELGENDGTQAVEREVVQLDELPDASTGQNPYLQTGRAHFLTIAANSHQKTLRGSRARDLFPVKGKSRGCDRPVPECGRAVPVVEELNAAFQEHSYS